MKKKSIKTKKVLINNVVPFNNGDVALFMSLYSKLTDANFDVKIATHDYKKAISFYPNLPLVPEIGQSKIFRKIKGLKSFLIPILYYFSKAYKEADIIIGAPGGYLNSFYNLRNSISIFKVLSIKKKITAIYSQSVGPLNKKDEKYLTDIIQNNLNFIFVRDQFSASYLKSLNINKDKFKLSKDIAFLLEDNSELTETKKAAISVREWKAENRNEEQFILIITTIIKTLIKKNYTVEFISTCQGIEGYKDDSILAQKIYNTLDSSLQKDCIVDNAYYNFDEFYHKLSDYSVVIGTRLHMCICSLTKNIPAFNISYEVKGKECYNYIGLSDYTIDYNEDIELVESKILSFLENNKSLNEHLKSTIPSIRKELNKDFDFFEKKINK